MTRRSFFGLIAGGFVFGCYQPKSSVWVFKHRQIWQLDPVAMMNGRLYYAFDSAMNRLHAWDGVTVRRVSD